MMKSLLALAVVGAAASMTQAAIIPTFTHSTVPTVAQDFSGVNASGDIANILSVSSTTDWTQAEIVLNLTSGSMFLHPQGSAPNPPNSSLASFFGYIPYTSYIQQPNGTSAGSFGAAVTLQPGATQNFSATGVNYNWYDTGTTDIGDNLVLGQFTLTPNATGTVKVLLQNSGGDTVILPAAYTIVGGAIVPVSVPEPASLGLLGLGLVGLAARRRQA